MNIQTRVEKLEQARGTREGCPVCGWTAGAPVVFHVNEDRTQTNNAEQSCEACGRPLLFTIDLKAASEDMTKHDL
jgi:hypothetical protein